MSILILNMLHDFNSNFLSNLLILSNLLNFFKHHKTVFEFYVNIELNELHDFKFPKSAVLDKQVINRLSAVHRVLLSYKWAITLFM